MLHANCIGITPDGIDHLEQLIPTSSDVVEFSRNRNKFLCVKFEVLMGGLDRYDLGNRLGFSDKTTEDVCHYLMVRELAVLMHLNECQAKANLSA